MTEYSIPPGHGFLPGTRIATREGELPIESLRIGDLVETLHGGLCEIKWIGRRNFDLAYTAGPQTTPIRITAGALDDGVPARDLRVSPGLGICIGGALIPAIRLVNHVTVLRESTAAEAEYFHVDLDEHEALLANGCPAETFLDDRYRFDLFENAAEYPILYPQPLPFPRVECLPRLEDGFVLQAVQHRLAERAGLAVAEPVEGPLRGFVDVAGPQIVAGWAQNEDQPEEPVCLDIFVDNIRVLRALANRYRADLETAGLGSGNHAFRAELPENSFGRIEVRRTLDQLTLPPAQTAAGWAGQDVR